MVSAGADARTYSDAIGVRPGHWQTQRPLLLATACSGTGAPSFALRMMGVPFREVIASEADRSVRDFFVANHPDVCAPQLTQRDKRDMLLSHGILRQPCGMVLSLGTTFTTTCSRSLHQLGASAPNAVDIASRQSLMMVRTCTFLGAFAQTVVVTLCRSLRHVRHVTLPNLSRICFAQVHMLQLFR